ncbi:MAG TPA: hypothetical protein VGC41_23755 [Kofleriaceae bacterium]
MPDNIAKAARKHRAKERREKAAADQPAKHDYRARYRDAMLRDALAGKGGQGVGIAVALIIGLGIPGAIAIADKADHFALIILSTIPAMLLGFGAFALLGRILANRAAGQVVTLFGPNSRYVEALHDNRYEAVVVVTFAFAEPPASATDLPDAVKAWVPRCTSANFTGTTLVTRSEPIKGHFLHLGGGATAGTNHEWSNRDLHSYAMHLIHVVRSEVPGITSVDAMLEGSTEPWDQDP